MFVVYQGPNEVLITTLENESEMIREWITEGQRDIQEYDRALVRDSVVQITTHMIVDG